MAAPYNKARGKEHSVNPPRNWEKGEPFHGFTEGEEAP